MASNSSNQEARDGDRNKRTARKGRSTTAANEKKMRLLECQFKSMSLEIEEAKSKINEIMGIVVGDDDLMKELERCAKVFAALIQVTTYLIEGSHELNQALKLLPQAEAEEELISMIDYMKNGRKDLKELMEVVSLLKKHEATK